EIFELCPSSTEKNNKRRPRCQPPSPWMIGEVEPMKGSRGQVTVVASRYGNTSHGMRDVVYMVINHQEEQSQRLHPMLAQRLSDKISLYKQAEQQPDVWQTLNAKKDDFIIYDRCGRLTHHISLPYSVIGHGHIESAIKEAYCNRMCGDCSHETAETLEACKAKPPAQPDADAPPAVGDLPEHDHSRHHGQGHHGHGHRHHGNHHSSHHRAFGRNHGHHHGNHNGDGHGSELEQSQQVVRPEEHQLQHAVETQQLLQQDLAAQVRP
uniref:Selenoprotein P N-terminal domain-containing protein n=1 Tax=Cyprinodon variegatus TaxID=28743 RepID=A0A3Q2CU29_CYPVA